MKNSNKEVKVYRVTIMFRDKYFKDLPPSNLFLRDVNDDGKENLLKYAESIFQEEQAKIGIIKPNFYSEIFESSEEEITIYNQNKLYQSNKMVV